MRIQSLIMLLLCGAVKLHGQQLYSASFIAKLGIDTVIVETYNMLPNHLYGKAFLRYPEDNIGVFDFHFYPDGSIKHYSMSFMNPDSSYITSTGTSGVFCEDDTCTWFASWRGGDYEYTNKRPVKQIDFIGGWTPTISLLEWNCMRLIKSGEQSLPITLINDYIGTRNVAIWRGNADTLIFGGDFLEYTKLKVTADGRIMTYDGTATPWNYIATKLDPVNVDEIAKRLSKTPKIGIPSPEVKEDFFVANDTINLSYGRPSKRGRRIFGGIVPYDSVWRTGAGDPTILTLPYNIQIGKGVIPKGKYALYTIPGTRQWTLIFNTDLKQWPTEPNRSKDFMLIPLKVKRLTTPMEKFTIAIEPSGDGGVIKFAWDDIEASTPFKILRE